MEALFVELPAFEVNRQEYLSDEEYGEFQQVLLANPGAGDIIKGTGGLRKVRFGDKRRGKGKRGGLRVIYYFWIAGAQFWLFTLYDKDEMDDLTPKQQKAVRDVLARELRERGI